MVIFYNENLEYWCLHDDNVTVQKLAHTRISTWKKAYYELHCL